jgi:alpha-galactosidase
MGWNSWNKFRNQVSDQLVREVADAMAKNGMKAAGYLYVNIDDTWEAGRDAEGNVQTNERFPDMKALGDYIHSKGLKFGIYSSPGPKTCAGYEGSFQHEEQDAKTYAAWGVDYLKYDWCSASQVYDYHSMPAVYAKMGLALENSGRPIVFSLCQYGVVKVQQWGANAGGNLWRTTGDIRDTWQSMSGIGFDQQASSGVDRPLSRRRDRQLADGRHNRRRDAVQGQGLNPPRVCRLRLIKARQNWWLPAACSEKGSGDRSVRQHHPSPTAQ